MNCIKTRKSRTNLEREKRVKGGPRPDFQQVHVPRNLRAMIKQHLITMFSVGAVSDCSDELIDAVIFETKLWLKDHSHARIMAQKHSDAVVINQLSEHLGE